LSLKELEPPPPPPIGTAASSRGGAPGRDEEEEDDDGLQALLSPSPLLSADQDVRSRAASAVRKRARARGIRR
jgi:hypothetical protein